MPSVNGKLERIESHGHSDSDALFHWTIYSKSLNKKRAERARTEGLQNPGKSFFVHAFTDVRLGKGYCIVFD